MTKCKAQNSDPLGQIECEFVAYNKWTAEMNRIYEKLLTKLDNDARLVLKEEQLAWSKYRDLHFEFNSKFYGKQGSLWLTLMASSKTDFVRNRANALSIYLDAIEKK